MAEPIPMPGKWHPVCFNMPQLTSQVTPPGGVLAELSCVAVHTTLIGNYAISEKPD